MGNRKSKSNHRVCQEYFCNNPRRLLRHLREIISLDKPVSVRAHPEYGLFNGKPYPITHVDVMLEIRTGRGEELYVPLEIKGTSDPYNIQRALKEARKQLRQHFRRAVDGKISFPTPDMMPIGLAVAGYPNYVISHVYFQ